MLPILAVRQHDDSGRRARLVVVAEHAQTAIDASLDETAPMILQGDVQWRADVGCCTFGRPPRLHLDGLELGVRAHAVHLAREPPGQLVVVATVCTGWHDNPVADGGEDSAWLETLRCALREHARDGRHEEFDVGLCAQDGVASLALQGDRVPRSFERLVRLPPDNTESKWLVTVLDHWRDELPSKRLLQERALYVVVWVAADTLKRIHTYSTLNIARGDEN